MDDTITIALCCIAKDENPYFEEWLNHYKNIGFDKFIIYDNNSSPSIIRYFTDNNISTKNITIINWTDEEFGSQSRAYLDCCQKYSDFNYIAFFDLDEFYMSKSMNVKEDLKSLDYPDGLGIYWRIYGKSKPYFQSRQSIFNYVEYKEWDHIKSILNPNKVIRFPDPHFATLLKNSLYINELNHKLNSPIGLHTSKNIWIKHIYTRSLEEFKQKIKKGDVNTRKFPLNIERFYEINDNLNKKDEIVFSNK